MQCLDVKGLSKSYGEAKAVDGITFSVKRGQVFGFLGPNGAGKSTTIKMLTTLVPPTGGTARVLGIDAIKDPLAVRYKIGVVLQQPSYEPILTVEQALDEYGMMWGVSKRIRKERIESLLDDFNLREMRHKRNQDLSIGQRRRVQVAREFMHDMDLLFLDEPTVGMDPSARRHLLDYLKDRVAAGLTIFYTTHVLSEAEYLCDEILIINKGVIVARGTPDSLKNEFRSKKTIKISASSWKDGVLDGVPGCDIDASGIIVESVDYLPKVLDVLRQNNIHVDELYSTATSLEDVFLGMVEE